MVTAKAGDAGIPKPSVELVLQAPAAPTPGQRVIPAMPAIRF